MDITLPPRLPFDLERTIFELAARSFRGRIPILLLVSQRVHKWVEAILYRLVIVETYTSRLSDYPVFSHEVIVRRSDNLEFLRASVRYLFIIDASSIPPEVANIVSACNLLKTLAYAPAKSPADLLRDKQYLQRLTINVTAFLACSPPESTGDPLLPSLTHLELLDTYWGHDEPPDLSAHLALVPNLTHLALNGIQYSVSLNDMLRADSRLRCIVFFADAAPARHPLSDDHRVVYVEQHTNYQLDWIRGIDGGKDYWALADAFIAARLTGQVDRSVLSIADTDRGIIDNGQWV
ncbi:hypothetical protein B0H16DRAFT_1684224 [Mycena metata]|uniref:Uncharacterized protein n=1 Tax=Mycena metata TaxID=1033252 RepID=A0AAD7K1N7_9AGAR|nr:hypothetical protein B0H16DRAFT_1684224 [Mycena metata]